MNTGCVWRSTEPEPYQEFHKICAENSDYCPRHLEQIKNAAGVLAAKIQKTTNRRIATKERKKQAEFLESSPLRAENPKFAQNNPQAYSK